MSIAKLRIYELAKELGVDNKILITKAQELGIGGIKSHSNSLDGEDVERLRRAFIRDAVAKKPTSEVVKTAVDSITGERMTIVERRKGDVVRRRSQTGETQQRPSTIISRPKAEEFPKEITEKQSDLGDHLFQDTKKEVQSEINLKSSEISESLTELTEQSGEIDEVSDNIVGQEQSVSDTEQDQVIVESVQVVEQELEPAKALGPRILGRINLPSQAPKPVVTARPKKKIVNLEVSVEVEEDEDADSKGKKKRGKRRELNRVDLVDYDARLGRKGGSKLKIGKKDRHGNDLDGFDNSSAESTGPKASKRVVKMAADVITVGELAKQMSLKAADVISKLIQQGVMATINQAIDADTATIIADDFGFTLEKTGFNEGIVLEVEGMDDQEKKVLRPPVVTVMGHVDHGKTSLLDYIRKASIAEREHGGITQHIGAYSVTLEDGRKVAFIDTPGHAAFTAMRARGAKVTDIVVLVVAADDGVMPQTIEALNHAKAAGVTIVVALNKIDKPAANPDKVKQQLSEYGLQPEEWGGDTMFYPVSALTGAGIPELLEGLALVSELAELKANPECRAVGTVLEARQEKGRGTVATILVQAGTLKVGDIFVSGAEYGRVRSLLDHNAKPLTEATPSMPVEITGFNGVPVAGDDFIVVVEESKARQVSEARRELKLKQDSLALAGGPISLEEFARMAREKEILDLNVIVKADVHGSLEAVRESIIKLSGEKVKVKVLHGAVGGVNESDVQLALASKALILGFGVRGEPRALAEAEANGVEVRFYRVIYELIDDVKNAMTGLLAPIKKEKRLGRVEVRNTFTVPKVGTVAGCYIQDGLARRNSYIRLLRDSRVIHEGKMSSLRRFKDDVKEVQTGYECGISIEGFNDIQTGDNMEIYEFEEIAATLD